MKIATSLKYYIWLVFTIFTLNSCITKTSYKAQDNDGVDETKKENIYRLDKPTPQYKQPISTPKKKTTDEFQPTFHRDNIFAPKDEKRNSPDFKQINRK